MSRAALASLRTFAGSAAFQHERCDFCGLNVAEGHAHVIDFKSGTPKCACQACALLFTSKGSGNLQRLESSVKRISSNICTTEQWTKLGIPVGLAWFFRDSVDGNVRAMYPGAAGPVEAQAETPEWCDLIKTIQPLSELEVGMEALLVRRQHGVTDCWQVTMDHCWKLAGMLRLNWSGFDGGEVVQTQMKKFFDELDRDSH